ncbi:MAG: hypothetical protein WAT93_14030 [Pontixanthobacter sp.]
MALFRIFLIAAFLAIGTYTMIAVGSHGWNLVPIFFGDIAAMNWPGQFNTDFFTFLLLSGIWIAWRNEFTPAALGLALVGVFGGMLFLSAYLLFLTYQTGGNIKAIMLGEKRARNG